MESQDFKQFVIFESYSGFLSNIFQVIYLLHLTNHPRLSRRSPRLSIDINLLYDLLDARMLMVAQSDNSPRTGLEMKGAYCVKVLKCQYRQLKEITFQPSQAQAKSIYQIWFHITSTPSTRVKIGWNSILRYFCLSFQMKIQKWSSPNYFKCSLIYNFKWPLWSF